MIENQRFRIGRADIWQAGSLRSAIERAVGPGALRWYITSADRSELVVEATVDTDALDEIGADDPPTGLGERPFYPGKSVVISIVPTGVGCAVGGYAGDAAPATNLLAATADYLVTNPNAVNASDFISLESNVLYTEGLCIDLLSRGEIDLHVPFANRVGLVIEHAEPAALDAVYNVVNTARAVHGVDVVDCIVTPERIGSRCVKNCSGAYVGTVDHPEVLLNACRELIAQGANAIAVTTQIQDLPSEEYVQHFAGASDAPNPMGGVEAVMSHMIVDHFRVPAAHAPMINLKQLDLPDRVVDARGGGEMASVSGLACVLIGLRRAPQIERTPRLRAADVVNINNVMAVVAPAGCLGGIPVLCAVDRGIPVIAVAANETILDVSRTALGIENGVIEARSYAEAAGLLLALRRGISIDSITRPLKTLRHRRTVATGVEEPRIARRAVR
jgi:hypothetical protein